MKTATAKKPRSKINSNNPLEARLLDQKATLLAQIETCDRDIEAAVLESGKKVVGARANVRVEDSALAPLIRLRAKRDVLIAALGQLEAKMADAPGKIAALSQAIIPLESALSARDLAQNRVEELLADLYSALMNLRVKNEISYEALHKAAKAWRLAGSVPELKPPFNAVRFDACAAASALRKDTPFAKGPLLMAGDSSGRSQSLVFAGSEE